MSSTVHSTALPPDLAGYTVHKTDHRSDAQPRQDSPYNRLAGDESQASNARSRINASPDADPTEQPSQDASQSKQVQDRVDISQEARDIQQLASRDREVRAHEAAHAAVGGQYAGAPSFTYETGPDGKRYAVAGEVSVDTAAIPGDPEATIDKMQQIRAAALAPAQPSAADRNIAAKASREELKAQIELAEEKTQTGEGPEKVDPSDEQVVEQGLIPEDTIEEKAGGVRTRVLDLTA